MPSRPPDASRTSLRKICRVGSQWCLHIRGRPATNSAHTGNRFIPLTDLATVTQQADPPSPEFRVNGKPALGLAISMARGGNIVDFGRALNATMDGIRAHLPYGISVEKVADQSAVVSDAVGGFVQVLVEAVIIVLAVSFVSLEQPGRSGWSPWPFRWCWP